MALIPQEISMNIAKQTEYVGICVPQYDNIDRVFYITLTQDEDVYTIPTTASVRFEMKKSATDVIYNVCPVEYNKIRFVISPAISAEAGRFPSAFRITDSATGGLIHSFRFHTLIKEGVDIENIVVQTSEFTALQDMELRVGDVSDVIESAEIATANAITATNNADAATTNATNAAILANDKAALADTATTNANNATTDLETLNANVTNAESVRVADETNRANAETTRISNETDRQEFFNAYKVCEVYNNTKQYVVGNKVTYAGSTYQCLVDTIAYAPPSLGDATWLLIAEKGADGTGGDMVRSIYDPTNKQTDVYAYADNKIGDLSNLNTESNTDLVGAINEEKDSIDTIKADIGDKTTLNTTDKSNLVNSINEKVNSLDFNAQKTVTSKLVANTNITRNINNINTSIVSIDDFSSFPFRVADTKENWTVSNGILKPNMVTGLVGNGAYFKNNKIQDGEISVTLKNYSTTVNVLYGIAFRGKDDKNYLVACVDTKGTTVNLYKVNNGVIAPIYGSAITGSQISIAGENINLKVKFFGAQIKIYYNGTLYIDASSAEYTFSSESNGYFGLFSYCEAGITYINQIEFSNFAASEFRFDVLKNKMSKGLGVGDSITVGTGASIPANSWANLLTTELLKENATFTFNNQGISGAKTSLMYTTLATYCNTTYDFVTIMGGVNDSAITGGDTLDNCIINIRKMIRHSKALGVIPLVCLTTNIDKTLNTAVINSTSWAYIQELVNRIRVLCSQEKVIIVNMNGCLNNDFVNNYTADHIHPNDAGNLLMFNEIYNTIKSKIV